MACTRCTRCGSFAINPNLHGRDRSNPDLCDVCYWRARAEHAEEATRGSVEQVRVDVTLLAEVQRNPDGTWSGMLRRLSGAVLTRPTKAEVLRALAELHSTKRPDPA